MNATMLTGPDSYGRILLAEGRLSEGSGGRWKDGKTRRTDTYGIDAITRLSHVFSFPCFQSSMESIS